MATHEIKPYANQTPTKDKAPFLASYVQKSTVEFRELVEDVAKESGMTEIEARTILEGTPEIIEALEKEALTRFNLPGGIVIEPVAYGTLEAANSAWNDKENSLELAFRMDEEYRNHLANVTPTIVTDVTVTKADIYRVFDIAVPQPTQLIHGQHPFRIQGKKLFPKAVYFENAAKQRFECDVMTSDPDGNAYEAKSRELLEPGDYKLIVETDAGDEGGILQYPAKCVKYLKVLPSAPKILSVTSKLLGGADTWKVFKDTLTVKLEEDTPKDADISIRLYDRATGQEVCRTVNEDRNVVTRIDEHTFTYQVESNNGEPPHTDGDWADASEFIVKLVVESAAGSDSRELTSVE